MAEVGFLQNDVLYKLFTSYCCSMYGVSLCDLTAVSFQTLCVAWRKAIRRVFHLPSRTHNVIVNLITGNLPVNISVECRITKLYKRLLSSHNNLLSYTANVCLYQSYSNMGKNVSYFQNNYVNGDLHSIHCECTKVLYEQWLSSQTDNDVNTAAICQELLECRDNHQNFVLNQQECNELLHYICTT